MPIVQTYPDDFGDNSKEEYLKRQLLEKIASAKYEVRTDFRFNTTYNRVKIVYSIYQEKVDVG